MSSFSLVISLFLLLVISTECRRLRLHQQNNHEPHLTIRTRMMLLRDDKTTNLTCPNLEKHNHSAGPFGFPYTPGKAKLGSPCLLAHYEEYGEAMRESLLNLSFIPPNATFQAYFRLSCEERQAVSNLSCNSEGLLQDFYNIPLQCGKVSGRCECLRSERWSIFTARELGTQGCLGTEGSRCVQEGATLLGNQTSRGVGLFCGFGLICGRNSTCVESGATRVGVSLSTLLLLLLTIKLFH